MILAWAGKPPRRGLQGSPVLRDTPAMAIAGLACSAALRPVGFIDCGWYAGP